jgi:hypothetical protein
VDRELVAGVPDDRDDLEQVGVASRSEVKAGVVVRSSIVIALATACSMSSSAMPRLRAAG